MLDVILFNQIQIKFLTKGTGSENLCHAMDVEEYHIRWCNSMGEIITYKNEGRKGVFCQIKLDNGERILISLAMSSIKIFELDSLGLIPTETIWECNWESNTDNLEEVARLFVNPDNPSKHILDAIIDKVINCQSIEEVKLKCKTPLGKRVIKAILRVITGSWS